MEFKISKCKSCGKEISLNTKSCPNCGDIDPFNKKAIKKLLRVLIVKDNFLALIKGTATFITICFAIYFAWGKSWPYWIVFILIATFLVNIIIDEDEKYFGTPFMQERLKFRELILESLENFIRANQEKLQNNSRYSKGDYYYKYILEEFWDCVIDQKNKGDMVILLDF
jgi:hypothetical protein